MKGRRQKTSQDNCPQNGRAEPESYEGVQAFIWMTEKDTPYTGSYGLLDQILSPTNLNAAYKQVKANKGAGGIDRMQVEGLSTYLNQHQDELVSSMLKGTYVPRAVLRVEIPKSDGGKRQLGTPTVVDRFVQQAISQVLTTIYEPLFHNHIETDVHFDAVALAGNQSL